MFSPLEDFKIQRANNSVPSGTGQITSAVVDCSVCDDVVFLTTIGTPNAGNFAKLQAGTKADGSDMSDIAGSKVTPTGAGPATILSPVSRLPTGRRYVQLVVVRAGAATTCGEIYVITFNKVRPQTSVNNTDHFGKPLYEATIGAA